IIVRKKKRSENNTVVVITSGLDLDTPNFLQNLIKILFGAFSGKIYIIISRVPFYKKKPFSERVHIKQIMPENEAIKRHGICNRIVKYLLMQLNISYVLAKEKKADAYIFFLAQSLILPILTLKLLGRNIILASGASISELSHSKKDRLLFFSKIEEKINYELSNRIVLYSPCLIKQWHLEKYTNKISIAHEHFIDFDKFRIKKQLSDRDNLVGYIGRLSEEKGSMNFVEAIPTISMLDSEIKFLIGGDGQLRDIIKKYLLAKDLNDKVKFAGWIPHDELPDYFNELKLLVLPSYTEGLPSIMLEAMACGTPVLATSVGAIPDIIKDGVTGFIMKNNSPNCIAKNVIRALDSSDLERIAKNARALVQERYTYEKAVERYSYILNNI
ncbi:MAG: glycosyltransferase family 4 protein, partial [Candidatus Methanoperedens sp.]